MWLNLIFFWLSLTNFQNSGNLIVEFDTTLNQGNLLVYIYNNPKGFPTNTKQAYLTKVIKSQHTKQVTISKLPYGTYAVMLIHDQNGNRKLDRNWLGLPGEPYALSGHPKFRFGPPVFDDVKFKFNTDGQIINVKFD